MKHSKIKLSASYFRNCTLVSSVIQYQTNTLLCIFYNEEMSQYRLCINSPKIKSDPESLKDE